MQDLNYSFAREKRGKAAEQLGFASFEATVGDLSDFDAILPTEAFFDFITLINTIHEIEPFGLPRILVNCLRRLTANGTIFIYDMDRTQPLELGVIPLRTGNHIRQIVGRLLNAVGVFDYQPEVGHWDHKTCNGWKCTIAKATPNIIAW